MSFTLKLGIRGRRLGFFFSFLFRVPLLRKLFCISREHLFLGEFHCAVVLQCGVSSFHSGQTWLKIFFFFF